MKKNMIEIITKINEEYESSEITKGYENINKREIDLLNTQIQNIDEKIKLLQNQKQEVQKRKQELQNKK